MDAAGAAPPGMVQGVSFPTHSVAGTEIRAQVEIEHELSPAGTSVPAIAFHFSYPRSSDG